MLRFFHRRLRNERGFTLIELLIVVAIIAILAAILIPNFLRARAQSQVSASKGNMKNIATALESYFVDNGSYPTTLAQLAAAPQNYLRSTPNDPCTNQPYVYTPTGSPPQDYALTTPAGWTSSPCNAIVPNGLTYTPGGGLSP
ncbi:MAG: prepilin-type N-terminal cleavage/methylation domain-containing protein [Armatimonadota bacterium]|nr:prepilin-type N-terminal cleavage/methylation domain-containing protein [Armatimonadota bacterium]MDR7450415.1 prepilin-type N-terminal cleavage/methylation domain-containing protein [Armatimonadota bacterium]MDR7467002.1 prepilin-type N-terminal cleavage/methylation domain-containing protein [Armatimonadota bacterium]MDR7493456.1 prepilin-type N-terminal cleavage/methylation domain-containing protein [Armatimonadota bacterium]MDR7498721.1 prepilin-type N-terminal cleavage/methylation domain